MKPNIKISLLAAAFSAVGLVSAAMADTCIETKSFSSECPTTSSVTRTTETVSSPGIVEESYRTIEKPVVIEQAPMVEERVRMHGNREKIKIKEYY